MGCDYVMVNEPLVEGSNGPQCQDGEELVTLVDESIVTYDRLKTEIFEPKCMRCHNENRAAAGVDLSSYERAKSFASQIDFVVSRNEMPPSQPLEHTEKGLIADWVKAGMPNTNTMEVCQEISTTPTVPPITPEPPVVTLPTPPVTQPEPPVVPPPPVVTPNPPVVGPVDVMPSDSELNFQFVRDRVFAFRCFACHTDEGGNRGGYNLETYANTIDELDDLQEVIEHQAMPPRAPLNALEQDVILRWIALGAPQ